MLLILAGIPGCGKSTLAKTFFDLKYAVVSSDAIRLDLFSSLKGAHQESKRKEYNARVFSIFHDLIRERLQHNVDVIADATNLNHFARTKLLDIADLCHAEAHLVLFKNLNQALERNAARDDDKRVPEGAMAHMVDKYWDTLARLPQEAPNYTSITLIERNL